MKLKKRKKSSRFRGSHTHGRGFKKKARGSGHRGGVGMAGSGKRGDAKKTLVLALYGADYFKRDRALRRGRKIEIKTMAIRNITDNINSFVKEGLAKEEKGFYVLNLKDYKIIGNDKINVKLKITCLAFSEGAKESVEKAGGEITAIGAASEKEKNEAK